MNLGFTLLTMKFARKILSVSALGILVTACGGGSSIEVSEELPYFKDCGAMQRSYNAYHKKLYNDGKTNSKYDFYGFDSSRKPKVWRETYNLFTDETVKLKNPKVVCSKGNYKQDGETTSKICTNTNMIYLVNDGKPRWGFGDTFGGSNQSCLSL